MTFRIKCPPNDLPEEKRIHYLLDQIINFIRSAPLKRLIEISGGKVPKRLKDKEYINWINDFAEENWNYRKALGKENERWNLKQNKIPEALEKEIIKQLIDLGVYYTEEPLAEPDYLLALGGAKLSNYERPKLTKEIIDKFKLDNKKIIGLSADRPLNEVELKETAQFAPEAKTEFDSISGGLEKAFGISPENTEERIDNHNPNLSSSIRKYKNTYNGNNIYSLSSPSSDENRRANSRDTFEFFLESFDISPGSKILLCTTNLYVPYQLLAFIDLAIKNNIYVDCIGCVPGDKKSPEAFLQELKAAINQVKRLYEKYDK